MKTYSDATLLSMTKKELIAELRMAENNCEAMEETLNQQAENVKDWEPVRHGRWSTDGGNENDLMLIECSECKEEFDWRGSLPNYCPHCGAKMNLWDKKMTDAVNQKN